jgi:hypothetical protein
MTTFEALKYAIENLKHISFTYKDGHIRIGQPYAIFIQSNNATKAHIVQTDGYTTGGILNIFKPFNIEDLQHVEVLNDRPNFIPDHPDYRPESPYYDKGIIAKV